MCYNISKFPETQVLQINSTVNEAKITDILTEIEEKSNVIKKNFIIDFSSLTFLNSNGINLLISLLKKSNQRNGKIALANVPDQVEEILIVTKLIRFFDIRPSVQDALISISEHA